MTPAFAETSWETDAMEFKLSMLNRVGRKDELKVNDGPPFCTRGVNFSLIFGFWLIVSAASIHP